MRLTMKKSVEGFVPKQKSIKFNVEGRETESLNDERSKI